MNKFLDILNKKIFCRKKYYFIAFLFISIVMTAEKHFIGIPKKAILVMSFFVFMIIFFWSKKIEKNVLMISLSFGILFSLCSPVFDPWDEPAHFTRVAYISEGHLFLTNNKDDHVVSKDVNHLERISRYKKRKTEVPPNTLKLKLWKEEHDSDKEKQFRVPVTNAYATVAYMPSLLGYKLGEVLSKGNLGVMFYLGRIFNSLFYSLCAFFAVKLAGKWNHIIAFFALQPLVIYISGSFNQDAFSYGLLLLIVSLFFKLIQEKEKKIGYKEVAIYTLLCSIMAYTKLPFIVLAGLIFFIPPKQFKNIKVYLLMLFGIIFVILISTIWFISYSKIEGLPPLSKNVDVSGQLSFIMSHPKEFIGILLTDIYETITKYSQLSSFAWDRYGSPVLALVNLIFIGIIFSFPMKDVEKVHLWTKFGVVIITGLITILIYLSMYLTWTDVGAKNIAGVQGRYFVGIVMLMPIVLNYSRYLGEIKENQRTVLMPQVMGLILLVWSIASRIGIYY